MSRLVTRRLCRYLCSSWRTIRPAGNCYRISEVEAWLRERAQVVGKLSLGHQGLGRSVLVLGITLHGLRDEIRSPLGSQALPARGDR